MRSLRKLATIAGAALLSGGLQAAPSVEITNVQQQYPWTNTVDITYTVQGVKTHQVDKIQLTNETYFATFEAKDSNGNPIADVNGNTVFTNGLVNGSTTETAQWQPAKDLQLTGCTMTPSVFRGEEDAYLVINLETNAQGKMEWWYEPMSTQEASNKRYNTNEYKTKKMVFRRIRAGTYTIGHSRFSKNLEHNVTFPEDFFISIFVLTPAQYSRIMGTSISTGMSPYRTNYTQFRGGALSSASAGVGVFSNLSTNTLLLCDMPTHAMYETAIRATSRYYFIADDDGSANKLYRAPGNVGGALPNKWGIFDPIPSYPVWLRDTYTTSTFHQQESTLSNGFIPLTGSTNYTIHDAGWHGDLTRYVHSPSNLNAWNPNHTDTRQTRIAIYPEGYYPYPTDK